MKQEQGNSGSNQLDECNENADSTIHHCYHETFSKVWREITSNNHLTLFGFRRYRITHLLNLRFLEAEIEKIDHGLYQAGLQLKQPISCDHIIDRLGLKQAKRDSQKTKIEEVVNEDVILRLRKLIKQYDECIFNQILPIHSLIDWFRWVARSFQPRHEHEDFRFGSQHRSIKF